MGHLDHATFGWLTPVLSYAMACIGAALGLRCTVRALGATGRPRRNWLLTAASAIGTGIWTMHFVAMLGFGVSGTDIRYDVPLTVLSLLVAMVVVCAGVFAVGYGRDRTRALLLGGLTTGLGVASMHYLGMAAVRLHGDITYDPVRVGLSVLIAVVAATAALWAALHTTSPVAVTVASLVMGAAVSSMHYTGMFAVSVRVTPSGTALPGATAMQFIFPLAVGLGSYLFLTSAFVALSPTSGEREASASAQGHDERGTQPGERSGTGGRPGPREALRHADRRPDRVNRPDRPTGANRVNRPDRPDDPHRTSGPVTRRPALPNSSEEAMRTPRRTPTAGAQPPRPVRGRRAHAGPPADETPDELLAEAAPDAGPDADADVGAPGSATPRPRRRSIRPRTVRARIVCLLMVPVVSLLALWGYATVTTAQDVSRLRQLQRVDAQVRAPLADAVAALQAERRAAVRRATAPRAGQDADLGGLARDTDRAVAALRLGDDGTVADAQELPSGVAQRLEAFVSGTEQLRPLRTAVLDGRTDWRTVYDRYSATIARAFAVGGALSGIQDAELGSDARVLLEFSRAGEALAQEDAVLASARPAGRLDGERLRLFTGAVDTRRALTASAVSDLRGPERTAWRTLSGSAPYATLAAAEDDVLAERPGTRALAAVPADPWDTAHARVQDGMRSIEADAGREVARRADPFARGLLTPAGAAVLLGLLAVSASLVISVRIGRGLVVELVGLRNGALEIARHKLPEAMRRLRAGEEIDIRAEAPPGPPAEDETGQVAEALGTVHRAALRAAVERAELASGISGVFVNLARRSQVLVHRQLSLLDSMERRSDDPNELSDLFRLDHLTTRMRRHAESLIILSGAAPGRAWRMPVSLTDVVRAAVSEVEDYARVEVRRLAETAVAGAAVADVTHLLAELVENAAQFSPPHTRVRVTGEPVGNGYAVEVEDRGLGMGRETLAEANRRIAQSEALDLFDSDRLGLFVVSRLASRHGIKVHLRTSPYGGTTAVVLLPTALLHTGEPQRSRPERAIAGQGAEDAYARVPADGRHEAAVPHEEFTPRREAARRGAVPAPTDRPALVAPARVDARGPGDGDPPPPKVTALHPHRSPEDADGTDGLPRRVRQASLAPQLRRAHAEDPAGPDHAREDGSRTPEVVRDRMAAYRDGWARGGGRRPGRGATPEPAPGSDSEGDPA